MLAEKVFDSKQLLIPISLYLSVASSIFQVHVTSTVVIVRWEHSLFLLTACVGEVDEFWLAISKQNSYQDQFKATCY